VTNILDQLRSGAGRAAFEAEKLHRVTAIRSEIRSIKSELEGAFLRAGEVAFRLYQSDGIGEPELREACAQIDALQTRIAAHEQEIERIQNEPYQEPGSGPEHGYLCPNGHGPVPDGARFCPKCGSEAIYVAPPAPDTACPACGTALSPEARFCGSCGTPIPEPASTSSPAPEGNVCHACGATLVTGTRFCPECGERA
jgi:RNA polymerase subunit RPABC4/transcription elongation factor Spt4